MIFSVVSAGRKKMLPWLRNFDYSKNVVSRLTVNLKYQHTLALILIKLEIDHDFQLINQSLSGSLRLVKGFASHYQARALITDAEHQPSSSAIRQSTATLRRFSKIKSVLRLFELDILSFFSLQQFFDSHWSIQINPTPN